MKNTISKKELEFIREHTPEELKEKQISTAFGYEELLEIARYTKNGANWSYIVYAVIYKNKIVRVVTSFGEIL